MQDKEIIYCLLAIIALLVISFLYAQTKAAQEAQIINFEKQITNSNYSSVPQEFNGIEFNFTDVGGSFSWTWNTSVMTEKAFLKNMEADIIPSTTSTTPTTPTTIPVCPTMAETAPNQYICTVPT